MILARQTRQAANDRVPDFTIVTKRAMEMFEIEAREEAE